MCVNAYQAAVNLYQMPLNVYQARLAPPIRLSLASYNSTCVHPYKLSLHPQLHVCVYVCVCVRVSICVTWHGRMESHFTELADVITLLLLQRLVSLITLIVVVDAFEVYAILIRIDCLVTHWTDSTLLTSPLHKTRSSCDATFACSWNVHDIRI